MTTDDRTLAELTQEVANAHYKLQGLPPAMAELQYIVEAQQLEGYGLEYYPAKVSGRLTVMPYAHQVHPIYTKQIVTRSVFIEQFIDTGSKPARHVY